jgi:hypothetical protein
MPADSSVPPIARLGHWPFTLLLVGIVVGIATIRSCGASGTGEVDRQPDRQREAPSDGASTPRPRAPAGDIRTPPTVSRSGERSAGGVTATGVARGNTAATAGDQFTLLEAIVEKQRDVWVEFEATVAKELPDDSESPRHQRFLLELPSGDTILIAHNIEVAARAPIRTGARVRVKGRYEWNDRGGVVHWTHRDERRGSPAGWIEVGGRRFE